MDDRLDVAPIAKGLVKPILIAGIDRSLFWILMACSLVPCIIAFSPFVLAFSAAVAALLIGIARFACRGDEQMFEVGIDSLSYPSFLAAQSGWNAPSAKHPRGR
jgi:type IV secretory pathway VirB3-like protein